MKDAKIGQLVENMGYKGVVIDFHHGDLILQHADGKPFKWIADSEKCEPVESAVRHRDGLVVFK